MDFVRFSDFSIDVVKSFICYYKFYYSPRSEVKERNVCGCETIHPKPTI